MFSLYAPSRPKMAGILFVFGTIAAVLCAGCPGTDTGLPPPVTAPPGDRPPTVEITSPLQDITVEAGDKITLTFNASDGEEVITVTLYVDSDRTPANGNELILKSDFRVGPGDGSGSFVWDTTGVTPGTYFPFAKADDGVNPAVIAASPASIQIVPKGTNPLNNPPALRFDEPVANLGLAANDTVVIRYAYRDNDSAVKVTLLLDKDQDPTNDDVNNPGDPQDPATNIIILPTGARQANDPVLPPDTNPAGPFTNIDNVEIRTNPRNFPSTPTGAFSTQKAYVFNIDFSKIPVRKDGLPYFIRATITDSVNPPVHAYAVGRLTVNGLANDFVDMRDLGVTIAGARFQGFSENEMLGSAIIDAGDGDLDSVNDFIVAGRFGSPRNRFQAGVAYLIRGRKKTAFPSDSNNNGRPDQRDSNGNLVEYPVPPRYVSPAFDPANPGLLLPYRPQFVGRFGGTISINSLGSFYRGTTIGMPFANGGTLPPDALKVPGFSAPTAGLVSIAQVDVIGTTRGDDIDGIPDFVFGLPFISGAVDYHDDDPCDSANSPPYGDGLPNEGRCDAAPCAGLSDYITGYGPAPCSGQLVDEGMVIIVSGANDIDNDGGGYFSTTPDGITFGLFMDAGLAGQRKGTGVIDDEGIIHSFDIPAGMRFRGGWFSAIPPIDSNNQFGRTVARLPSFDNDNRDELIISLPGDNLDRGRVDVWLGANLAGDFYDDTALSLPSYGGCVGPNPPCHRAIRGTPVFVSIIGESGGDNFGFGRSAGDFNQDGPTDVLAGSPNASRDGRNGNGVAYILATPAGGFGNQLVNRVPRIEIHGTHDGDHFGEVHDSVGDINGDGVEDVAIAAPMYDDDITGNRDAGFVGVIYGNRPITGERVFFPEQFGSAQLAGVRFLGATIDARAGTSVAGAGDFNQDGFGDLLIASPGEVRVVNGEQRMGVAYLIFGGPHLFNKTFNLSQVGSPALPGIVFVSPYVKGTTEEAAIETVAGIGDIDADGFTDIALGMPHADFVYPPQPNQRRIDAGEFYVVYGSNFGKNKITP